MRLFLYWLYYWQIKEYRFDRMRLALRGEPLDILFYLVFVGRYRRPKFTMRILITAVLSVFVAFIGWNLLFDIELNWVLVILFTYFLIPLWISVSVFLLNIGVWFFLEIIILLAKLKVQRLSKVYVIGITGSYGKTSTKEIVATVMAKKGKTLATKEGNNTIFAICRQILLELNPQIDYYIVEMGAYKKGEIQKLCQVVRPKMGILTGINDQHLGLFGNQRNIIEAKFELIKALPSTGVCIINSANSLIVNNLNRIMVKSILSYQSTNVRENWNIAGPLIDYFQIDRIDNDFINNNQVNMHNREEVTSLRQGVTLINDSYSCNSTGFLAAIEYLLTFNNKRKVVVTTGIYDLGVESQKVNGMIDQKLAELGISCYLVEAQHQRYFPHARLLDSITPLIDDNLTNTVILLEGRNRLITHLLNSLIKKYG